MASVKNPSIFEVIYRPMAAWAEHLSSDEIYERKINYSRAVGYLVDVRADYITLALHWDCLADVYGLLLSIPKGVIVKQTELQECTDDIPF